MSHRALSLKRTKSEELQRFHCTSKSQINITPVKNMHQMLPVIPADFSGILFSYSEYNLCMCKENQQNTK
ncbi:unnamed protein product [Brugia timori]|uniref:Ovule protein n=1 Tax=Brugia timori TaxID=42155 RepID=A0A0R3QRF5_9BILA|nr:unnamed protein product [Brugia timori]